MRLFVGLFLTALCSYAAVGVRVVMGLTDTNSTKWDGSVSAQGARISSVEGWRFDMDDQISGTSWKMSTHSVRLFNRAVAPVVANGVTVWLEGENDGSAIEIRTAQGNFTLKLSDIPYGTIKKSLDGRVMADRVPPATRVTDSPDEQDMPAAASRNGEVWIAYLDFKHNPEHNRLRTPMREEPGDLSIFKSPAGGDQIMARRYANGAWGQAIEVSQAGGDVYRPAIAIDGSGKPWVFWSSNTRGDFELFAAAIENGRANRAIRITEAKGSDIDPAAATDSAGKVWVAWQGWRNGKAGIFAASQAGTAFSKPAAVSSPGGNEWNPCVAADSEGRVTVAWDSYRNGNYDVYARTAMRGGWGKEISVATSDKYEAYPTAAYDKTGRLWIAYEEGGKRWGKDWGAYDTGGVSLYQNRAIRLVGFEKSGSMITTSKNIGEALHGQPNLKIDELRTQGEDDQFTNTNPQAAGSRNPSATPQMIQGPKNTLPRLHVDPSGRLWLAYRTPHPIWWVNIGTVWSEYVVSYDGSSWSMPAFVAHSDNLLDNRPALASTRGGELIVVNSSDGRRVWHGPLQAARPGQKKNGGAKKAGPPPAQAMPVNDPYNNDLWASTIVLGPGSGNLATKAMTGPRPAPQDPMIAVERKAVAGMRQFRLPTKQGNLQLVRGEFHRHSEISMDGGNDGAILEQWRYALDAGGMDWIGCCDHDNGSGREYTWWMTQKQTDIFYNPGSFVPMFNYERSVAYPEGHRNVIFAQRGIRTLPRLPISAIDDENKPAPDTQMLYRYVRMFDGIVASHTSGTNMGTDWRDNDPNREPVVEIYQGDRQNYEMPGAPRTNSENDSIGGWRPKGFVSLALQKGYKLGFQSSSDHISTHLSYCNLLVKEPTREAVLAALKKRHVYGATDNILADVRCGDNIMGDAFDTTVAPQLRIKLTGTAPFAKVHIIKDNKYVYSTEPNSASVDFTWKDNAPQSGKTSYYYVRGEQKDGNIVWVSPMWVTYKGN